MATVPTSPNPDAGLRAQRLLEAMHPVCSHDLPNQAVALQSLLQLFAWDEADQLSPQGREYFERLQSIAAKTTVFVRFLKELARLQRLTPHPEKLPAGQIMHEVRTEAERMFPAQTWTWKCDWHEEPVTVDRRLVHHGLLHLLRSVVLGGGGAAATVEMQTTPHPDHVAWTIAFRRADPVAPPAPAAEAIQLEQRLALTLAQEYLAATDIACRAVEASTAGVTSFALMIPALVQGALHG